MRWRTYYGPGARLLQAASPLRRAGLPSQPSSRSLRRLPHSSVIRRVHSQPCGPVHLSCYGSQSGSGNTVSAQAKLGTPHYRLPRADTERTANAARETACTIKRSREVPRAEASPEASGGGKTGGGEEGMTQSKARVTSDACPPWETCILSLGYGIGRLLEVLSKPKFPLLRLQICSVCCPTKRMHLDIVHPGEE